MPYKDPTVQCESARKFDLSDSIHLYHPPANITDMTDNDDSSFKSALITMAGDLVQNPVIGPIIEEVAYDFISSPECREAFAAYAKRRIKEKVRLSE